jgi:hypothetical protein
MESGWMDCHERLTGVWERVKQHVTSDAVQKHSIGSPGARHAAEQAVTNLEHGIDKRVQLLFRHTEGRRDGHHVALEGKVATNLQVEDHLQRQRQM